MRRFDRRRHLPVVVLFLAIAAQLAMSLRFALDGWFGVDALHYIAERGGAPGDHTSIFAPYAGHWQPALILMYRGLFAVFGFETYLPYVLPAVLTHLVLCALLYALLRRLGVSAWVGLATVWLLVFFGAGAEVYISDAPFALSSALTLGVAATYLLVRSDYAVWSCWVAAALLTLAIMISVTGVVAIVFVLAFLLGVRGWRTALWAAGPPLAVFLVWFAVSGRTGGRARASAVDLLEVPRLVWSVLPVPLADASAISGAGVGLTLLVIAASFLARGVPPQLRALAWAGILAAAVQLTLSAVANVESGVEAVSVGRYRYIVLVGLLPAVALTLEALVARFRDVTSGMSRILPALIVASFLVGSAVHGVVDERGQWRFNTAIGNEYESYTRGTLAATDLGERMLTDGAENSFVNGPDLVRLADPDLRDEFPDDFKATAEDRLFAENALFVGVDQETFDLPAPASISSADFHKPLANELGCRMYRATSFSPLLSVTSFQGAQISVRSHSSLIRTKLVRDGVEGEVRTWGVEPGGTFFIGTTAQVAELYISFDSGRKFRICRA